MLGRGEDVFLDEKEVVGIYCTALIFWATGVLSLLDITLRFWLVSEGSKSVTFRNLASPTPVRIYGPAPSPRRSAFQSQPFVNTYLPYSCRYHVKCWNPN